jgi:protein-L-isoaspartate(D-aspartate) O-methyltransferase
MTTVPDEREGFAAFLLRMRSRGIAAKELFAAMEATPRKGFVPLQWQDWVWSNRMVPIECGETLEPCDLQAVALAMLDVQPEHRVLEIGTGSGYTAAVLSRLAKRVLSVERYRTLAEQARLRLEGLGIDNVLIRQADGTGGATADGPFDRIIVWAAFDSHPRQFVEQLSSNGIMIAPVGPAEEPQMLMKLLKTGSRFERFDIEPVRLQALVRGLAQAI